MPESSSAYPIVSACKSVVWSASLETLPLNRKDLRCGFCARWLFSSDINATDGAGPDGVYVVLGPQLAHDDETMFAVSLHRSTLESDLCSILTEARVRPSCYDVSDALWISPCTFPRASVRHPVMDGSLRTHPHTVQGCSRQARKAIRLQKAKTHSRKRKRFKSSALVHD